MRQSSIAWFCYMPCRSRFLSARSAHRAAFAVAMCVAIVGMYTLVFLLFHFMLRFSLSESVLAALAASAPAAPFMGPAILGDLRPMSFVARLVASFSNK